MASKTALFLSGLTGPELMGVSIPRINTIIIMPFTPPWQCCGCVDLSETHLIGQLDQALSDRPFVAIKVSAILSSLVLHQDRERAR